VGDVINELSVVTPGLDAHHVDIPLVNPAEGLVDQLNALVEQPEDTARTPVRAGQLIPHQHPADPDSRTGLPVVHPPGHRDRLSLLGRNAVHLTDPSPTPGVPFWHAPVGRRPWLRRQKSAS